MIGNKCGGVDRIVCRAERRRVGQVETLQIEDGHFAGDGRGKNVGPLVHAVFAHDLRAQQASGPFFGNDLDPHRPRAGIITGVVGVNRYAGEEAESGFGSLRAVEAGEPRGHVQNTDNGSSKRAGIDKVPARRIGPCDAALAVGRAGQRNARARAGEHVRCFGGIAHGVDVRVGRLHAGVDFDAASNANFKPRAFGKFDFGANAHAEQDQFRRNKCAIGKFHAIRTERFCFSAV